MACNPSNAFFQAIIFKYLQVEADLPITVTVVALTNLAMAVTAEVPAAVSFNI